MLIWAIFHQDKLTPRAAAILKDSTSRLIVNQGTLWELLAKAGRGKLRFERATVNFLLDEVMNLGVNLLPITLEQVILSVQLPHHHSDPFDRLLIAHAIQGRLPVLTADPMFCNYDIDVIWD